MCGCESRPGTRWSAGSGGCVATLRCDSQQLLVLLTVSWSFHLMTFFMVSQTFSSTATCCRQDQRKGVWTGSAYLCWFRQASGSPAIASGTAEGLEPWTWGLSELGMPCTTELHPTPFDTSLKGNISSQNCPASRTLTTRIKRPGPGDSCSEESDQFKSKVLYILNAGVFQLRKTAHHVSNTSDGSPFTWAWVMQFFSPPSQKPTSRNILKQRHC